MSAVQIIAALMAIGAGYLLASVVRSVVRTMREADKGSKR